MYTYLQTEGLNMTYGIQTVSIRICWYPDILLASSLFKNSIASQISKFTKQLLNSEYSSCHEQWSMNMSMDNFDGAEDFLIFWALLGCHGDFYSCVEILLFLYTKYLQHMQISFPKQAELFQKWL